MVLRGLGSRAAELCVIRQMPSSAGRSQYLLARGIRRLLGNGKAVFRLLFMSHDPLRRIPFHPVELAEEGESGESLRF